MVVAIQQWEILNGGEPFARALRTSLQHGGAFKVSKERGHQQTIWWSIYKGRSTHSNFNFTNYEIIKIDEILTRYNAKPKL